MISEKGLGMIHIYTGNGKGKTTAAVGLAVRAVGAGMTVLFAQFLKGQDTSELVPLQTLGVRVIRDNSSKKFIPYMSKEEREDYFRAQRACFETVCEKVPRYDVIILDEIMAAVSTGILRLEEVIALVRSKPDAAEMVLTGRDAPPELVSLADYVSEISAVRHPYDRGVQARRGIEF